MPNQIRIESLTPQPLPDLRRVSLVLRVSGLPPYGPGAGPHIVHFPDLPAPEAGAQDTQSSQSPPRPNAELFPDMPLPNARLAGDHPMPGDHRPPSPYPDVSLSVLDQNGNEVATAFIVEHKEPELDFTLHLRAPEPSATYIARAEMTLNETLIQMVQVPFILDAGM